MFYLFSALTVKIPQLQTTFVTSSFKVNGVFLLVSALGCENFYCIVSFSFKLFSTSGQLDGSSVSKLIIFLDKKLIELSASLLNKEFKRRNGDLRSQPWLERYCLSSFFRAKSSFKRYALFQSFGPQLLSWNNHALGSCSLKCRHLRLSFSAITVGAIKRCS